MRIVIASIFFVLFHDYKVNIPDNMNKNSQGLAQSKTVAQKYNIGLSILFFERTTLDDPSSQNQNLFAITISKTSLLIMQI